MILLETKRLIVKSTSVDNLENIHALYSNPEVMRYVGHGIKTAEESQEAVNYMIRQQKEHGFSSGDVYEKETGIYVGRAGLSYLETKDGQSDIEVGCILDKPFWRKGYGTELVRAFLLWGFNHLPVNRLVATFDPQNQGSRQIVQKLGMSYVGKQPYLGKLHASDREVEKYEIFKIGLSGEC